MTEPITVLEAADYLRLDVDTSPIPEQDQVSRLIISAREAAENFTNRTIATRERSETYDVFNTVIHLPDGDVSSIVSIAYIDTDGNSQTVADWILSKNRLTAAFGESWPPIRLQLGAVTITYNTGYADDTVPEPIVQAMYLMISDSYDNRTGLFTTGAITPNPAVENLLFPYRIDLGQ